MAKWAALMLLCHGLILVTDLRAQTPSDQPRILTIPPDNQAVAPRANEAGRGDDGDALDLSQILEAPKIIKLTPGRSGETPPPPPLPEFEARTEPEIPRTIQVDPLPMAETPYVEARPKVVRPRRDSTGLVPRRPPGSAPVRDQEDVAEDVADLIEVVKNPEAEISVVIGESRIIQTRKPLTRVVVAQPAIADVELLADETETRLLNVFGRSFGNTSLTLWDETGRAVSFLVRVTVDTEELESRINQTFPGAQVKVRQVSSQIILDGQVPDSKMMADVLQLVTSAIRSSGPRTSGGAMGGGMGGMGGGGMGSGAMSGGSMGGGGMGGGGGGMGGMGGGATGGGMTIINRVVVPGPRQVLLHVKIAELNRQAIRELGVSWLNTRGDSIVGSTAGQIGTVVGSTLPDQPTGVISGSQLFGIFDAGQFSLLINALRANSLAKVLAEPNLVALDGQPARFLVGGEFPFPVPQSSSIPGGTAVVTVLFKKFGTILNFLPEILPNDVIRLDVEPVISNLDFAQGTTINGGPAPAIIERSARTVVELREGQTLAIAGLIQLRSTGTTSRIPGLGDMPLVGPWFSHNRIETIETETIILITPELVSAVEKDEVGEAPGDRVYQPTDVEFYFLGRIEGKLGREFRATVADKDPLNVMKHFQSEQEWVIGPHGYAD